MSSLELRIARAARVEYGFDEALFRSSGDAIVAEPGSARRFAERLVPSDPAARDRVAVELSALGLIHELWHRAIAVERRRTADGGPMARALAAARSRLGASVTGATLEAFEQGYPASAVYRGELSAAAWLSRADAPVPGPEESIEETALLWLANQNRAAAPYRVLIDDAPLHETGYGRLLDALRGTDLPVDEPDPDRAAPAHRLMARLIEPLLAEPDSLQGQLRWIRANWAGWLEPSDLARIDAELAALDEQARLAWLRFRSTPGTGGDTGGPAFSGLEDELEGFSPDREWMPNLVLLAKSTYVWLEQLSRFHRREIGRLDQIPDEVLDEIAAAGFSGLWLIGIWQRSRASERIKRMRGDAEAVASAYSIEDYRIADDLGGDDAWRDLRDRAALRGIRLASDMVPNHMGIDSRWVVEHPGRFIGTSEQPFPSYSFTGPDLSSDDRVVIQLEDHYWDASDAAVVFKRIDRASGDARYIYHGNDGTSFPWNDTAQLDYLQADVREAVIEQILEVARRFRIIRFDAAMVLARRHVQRLWYPLPGHEGGIPSRSAHALPATEFARRMPLEFWREVVDRVATEVPDTLLLAEAFWLMEGYFVRTLGMHRVYNSAFMHMLRDEKNAEYQAVMRETIAFDPRILGRYVNFMNNPDERTAVDQFGSHDKYFGVATVLVTLPGLPMFGHGQVEGFTEKYGMEFRRARQQEWPDEGLVARHHHEIFPLIRQRWRFAGVEHFRQLSVLDGYGGPIPDVFAHSNRGPDGAEGVRSLVVFLNRYPRAHVFVQGVAEALGLEPARDAFLILRDERAGLDYLRSVAVLRERGLELALDGYRCHVFLRFQQIEDTHGAWARLAWQLGLDGVPDAHAAMRRLRDEPLRMAVADLLDALAWTPSVTTFDADDAADAATAGETGAATQESPRVVALARLSALQGIVTSDPRTIEETLVARLAAVSASAARAPMRGALMAWAIAEAAASAGSRHDLEAVFDDWGVAEGVGDRLRAAGISDGDAWRAVELGRVLVAIEPGGLVVAAGADGLPGDWFASAAVRRASGWNEWQGRTYLAREAWQGSLEALAARDDLLGLPGARAAARVLMARATAVDFELSIRPSG